VTFTITPQGAVKSGAGNLAAGNYALTGTGVKVVGDNFTTVHYVGNQTVNRAPLTPLADGVTKTYDGTTGMTDISLGMAGQLAGDAVGVKGSGTFSSRNAGTNLSYYISGLALNGADAGNYYLASASLSGNNGTIRPRQITVTAVPATKVYDGTPDASGTPTVTGSLAAGDGFTLLTQAFTTANAGTRVTLAPSVQIDDGNGGANYAVTLVDNKAGIISTGVETTQLGVIHAVATLNHNNGEGQSDRITDTTVHCGRGLYQDNCGTSGDGVYKIVDKGLKLPRGLVLSP
jgi:hypothetical protein